MTVAFCNLPMLHSSRLTGNERLLMQNAVFGAKSNFEAKAAATQNVGAEVWPTPAARMTAWASLKVLFAG
jgi:hypothetical protein